MSAGDDWYCCRCGHGNYAQCGDEPASCAGSDYYHVSSTCGAAGRTGVGLHAELAQRLRVGREQTRLPGIME
jgi:hypothetical protein